MLPTHNQAISGTKNSFEEHADRNSLEQKHAARRLRQLPSIKKKLHVKILQRKQQEHVKSLEETGSVAGNEDNTDTHTCSMCLHSTKEQKGTDVAMLDVGLFSRILQALH